MKYPQELTDFTRSRVEESVRKEIDPGVDQDIFSHRSWEELETNDEFRDIARKAKKLRELASYGPRLKYLFVDNPPGIKVPHFHTGEFSVEDSNAIIAYSADRDRSIR